MKKIDALKARTAEILKEKQKRIEAAEQEIKTTASKAAEIEKQAAEAHKARDYEKEIELQAQAAKLHKIEAEYIKDLADIKSGVLIELDEYESAGAEVMKELQAFTADNKKKICKLLIELKKIKDTEAATLKDANSALKVWQFDVNGARDVEKYGTGVYNVYSLLEYRDFSNVEYLTYILDTMNATNDFLKAAEYEQ